MECVHATVWKALGLPVGHVTESPYGPANAHCSQKGNGAASSGGDQAPTTSIRFLCSSWCTARGSSSPPPPWQERSLSCAPLQTALLIATAGKTPAHRHPVGAWQREWYLGAWQREWHCRLVWHSGVRAGRSGADKFRKQGCGQGRGGGQGQRGSAAGGATRILRAGGCAGRGGSSHSMTAPVGRCPESQWSTLLSTPKYHPRNPNAAAQIIFPLHSFTDPRRKKINSWELEQCV